MLGSFPPLFRTHSLPSTFKIQFLHLSHMKNGILLFLLFFSLSAWAQINPVPAHQDDDIMKPMGFKNPETGKWVIPPTFDYVKEFGPKGTAVVYRNGKAGFIDRKGLLFISPTFDDADNFNEDGVAIVRKAGSFEKVDAHMPSNDRFGAIDMSGRLIIPYVFKELNDNSFKGTLVGKRDFAWGIIDIKGKVVIPFKYTMINVHKSREVAIVRHDSMVAVIRHADGAFTYIVPEGDNMARFAGNRRISVMQEGKYGYIDFEGNLVIPYEFSQFSVFREGLCMVKRNGYYGFIDTLGKTVVPFEYDGGEFFVNDSAIMLKQGKMGVINSKNEVLIQFIYDRISRYYFPRPPGGLVLIKQGIWHYIDPVSHEIKVWENFDLNNPNFYRDPSRDKPKEEKAQPDEEGDDK